MPKVTYYDIIDFLANRRIDTYTDKEILDRDNVTDAWCAWEGMTGKQRTVVIQQARRAQLIKAGA